MLLETIVDGIRKTHQAAVYMIQMISKLMRPAAHAKQWY
jgi:hypothetical protein